MGFRQAAALILVAGIVSCTQALPTKPAVSAFPDDATILSRIKARVDDGLAAGIVVGLLEADGSTRFISYGDPGPGAQKLGPDSLFQIGSTTKVFTATILADMAERGEVQLDDPAQIHAPADLVLPQKNGKQITLAQLAEQMSGLPRDAPNRPIVYGGPSYAALTKEMLYGFLRSYELPRDPGETFEYSNLGFGLLGHILSAGRGMDYDTLVHQRVLDPLGMSMSGVSLTPQMKKMLAVGHGPDGLIAEKELEENWKMPRLEGAGDLYSTATDLLKFLKANIGPPKTTLERAMEEAHKPRVTRPQGGEHGLGWNRYRVNQGPDIVFHSGAMPGYGSWIGFDPKRRVGVVLLQNTAFPWGDFAWSLLDPAAPSMEPTLPHRTEIKLPPEALQKFVGLYQWNENPNADKFRVTVQRGYLTTQSGVRAREAVFPMSEMKFFYRSADTVITFTTSPSGTVTGLTVRQIGKDSTAKKIE